MKEENDLKNKIAIIEKALILIASNKTYEENKSEFNLDTMHFKVWPERVSYLQNIAKEALETLNSVASNEANYVEEVEKLAKTIVNSFDFDSCMELATDAVKLNLMTLSKEEFAEQKEEFGMD
jgi:hypothetical protein